MTPSLQWGCADTPVATATMLCMTERTCLHYVLPTLHQVWDRTTPSWGVAFTDIVLLPYVYCNSLWDTTGQINSMQSFPSRVSRVAVCHTFQLLALVGTTQMFVSIGIFHSNIEERERREKHTKSAIRSRFSFKTHSFKLLLIPQILSCGAGSIPIAELNKMHCLQVIQK